MNKIAALLLIFLLPRLAFAAVTVDTTSTLSHNAVTTETVPHTITGTETLLLCTVAGTTNRSVTSYTYDGTAMTLVARADNLDSGNRYVAIYKLATGTGSGTAKNAVVTLSGIEDTVMVSCTSFTGVDQTTPTGTAATSYNSSGTAMPSVTITVPTNGMGFDAGMFALCGDNVPGGSQTQRSDFCSIDSDMSAFSSTISATGAQTFTWTLTGSHYWAQVAVPINAAAPPVGAARRMVVVVQ